MPNNDNAPTASHDDLAQLLALALDGGDETRILLMTRLILMNLDGERDADLDRLRKAVATPKIVRL
ncbi:hypothetical protein [Methylobacterium sp. B1]|uniref:hypothetical protein n=1 Tax=Methylobacterium sp. B1 TaxID=91459 RepID=UPI0003449897|nr:hypothetical protein [Methylobacterium sp. B1]